MDQDDTTTVDDSTEGTEQPSSEENSSDENSSTEGENEEKELTEEQKKEKQEKEEKEEQDRRARQGQVKKQFEMIVSDDDYSIDDVPERLKDEVIEYQDKISNKLKKPEDEDKVNVEEVIDKKIAESKETDLLETELNKLGEKEATLAEETYADLKEHGYGAREARIKTIALHSIPSDTEYSAHAGRSHKVGGNARTQVKTREDDAAAEAEAGLPPEFKKT